MVSLWTSHLATVGRFAALLQLQLAQRTEAHRGAGAAGGVARGGAVAEGHQQHGGPWPLLELDCR